jgi:hypothetical protein
MKAAFPRVYKSFEEFEREELRGLDRSANIDDMLDDMFAEELDFDSGSSSGRKGRRQEEDDE